MSRAAPRPAMADDGTDAIEQIGATVAERRARLELDALLVAERTMMGWVRTGIQLMALGFMLSRFEILVASGAWRGGAGWITGRFTGALVVVQGAVVCAVAAIRYLRATRAIRRGDPVAPDAVGPAVMALGNVVLGILLATVVVASLVEGR